MDELGAVVVPGFRFASVAAGVKKSGTERHDVALLDAGALVPAAAVFTRNRVRAAPVRVSEARVRAGRLRGVIVNSGNANACTGAAGLRDAEAMTRFAATAAGGSAREWAVASTGVIGVPLPMDRVADGIERAGADLNAGGFAGFAHAILTTDSGVKAATRTLTLGRRRVILAGCTKGAGMIAPNMATTLTFLATDAACAPAWLRRTLAAAVDGTYNRVTVDGDTSTNDSVFLFAGGAAANSAITSDAGAGAKLRTALFELLHELALMLVKDGEGARHLVRIRVTGAKSEADARRVARRIAESPLCKTAFYGRDPNWGRILCAAGNAGVPLVPERLALHLDDVLLVERGLGLAAREPGLEARAHAVMSLPAYTVRLHLGVGRAEASLHTCDLGHDYVKLNADYRS